MLRSLTRFLACPVHAIDGPVGVIQDFCVDEQDWALRCLVVDLRAWIPGRRARVFPAGLRGADWRDRHVRLMLTRDWIREATLADIDRTQQPGSRLVASEGRPQPPGPSAVYDPSTGSSRGGVLDNTRPVAGQTADQGGRARWLSARRIRGAHIVTPDDSLGQIEDLLGDDTGSMIPYIVVSKGNRRADMPMTIPTAWIRRTTWDAERMVMVVDVARRHIEPASLPDRAAKKRPGR